MSGVGDRSKLQVLQKGIDQVAIVVKDLDRAVEAYWKLFGVGPWRIYTYGRPLVKEMSYRGQRSDFKYLIALAQVGDLNIELIQTLEGNTIYGDFVAEHGYGMHHVAHFVEDMQAALAEARDAGFSVTQEGSGFGVDGSGHYAYLDTEDVIGVSVELVELPKKRAAPERVYPPEAAE